MTALSAARLESLLKAAERAHATYEQRLGYRDEDWPKWYAEFIVRQIADEEATEKGP